MKQKFTRSLLLVIALTVAQFSFAQCGFLNKQENGNTYYPRVNNQTVGIGEAAFLRFAVKNGGNTGYHFETCGSSYDTQLTGYNSGATGTPLFYNDDACGTQSSVDWTSTFTGTLYVQNSEYNCNNWQGGFGSATLTYRCVAPNSPAPGTAGNGTWNIYCYDAGDAGGGSGAWSSNYAGYYTDNTLNFNTQTRWVTGGTPYDANNASGNAYVGCYIPADNHSWRAVRTNISCGTYQIQVTHDDIGQILINGTTVYNNASCCASTNAGTFVITTSDVVEYRVSEGGGGSNGLITFNASGTALNGGTIGYSGSTAACAAYNPPAFTNSADASGGASAAAAAGVGGQGGGTTSYQWQLNGSDIGGATAATYDPGNLTSAGTYAYRRKVTDKCGAVTYSNTVTITITSQPSIPTLNTKTPNVAAICQGQSVSATINAGSGGGSGAADSYEFSTNGGSSWSTYTSGGSINTASATGSVQVRVSRSGGSGTGCSAVGPTVIATWTVNISSTAPTSISGISTICNGGSTTLTVSGGSLGTGATWNWYSGSCGGTLVGTGSSISVSPTSSTTYFVRAEGTCNTTSCASQAVTVNTLSTAPTSISGTNTICNGGSTTLTVSGGSLGTGATWRWYSGSCGGTLVGSGSSISVSPTSNTTYFVRAEGTCNTTSCASQTVTVNTLSTAPTSISGTNTICNGGSTTLTVSGGSLGTGATWNWYSGSCGGTLVGTGSSISVSPTSSTTYFVRAEGTCNTTSCASQAVTVNTLSTAPTSISGTSTICNGGNTTLTVSGGSLGTGATWNWYSGSCGGTFVGSGSSISVSPTSNTTYFVRAEGTCNTTSCASQLVTVNPVPSTFTVNLLTSTPLCYNGTASIEVPSSDPTLTYQLRDNTTNVGAAQAGNSGSLYFLSNSLIATNADYNVIAVNASNCTTAVSIGSIAVDAIPAGYANNNDVRTCYVNSTNYVEFRSANGIMVGINSNGQNLGNVTVTEYAGSPVDVQACNTYQPWYVTTTLGRHWAIEPQFQPSSAVSVRLYYDNSDYTALQTVANANANPNDDVVAQGSLDLSKYSNPNPAVINGTFTDNCNNGGSSTVHTSSGMGTINGVSGFGAFVPTGMYNTYSISSFSEFWLSGTTNVSPLPIELQSFDVTCEHGMVRLDWVTASEINNEKFIIERSANLQTWENVLEVAGAGNSNQTLSYTSVDERPLQGLSYYRLTQKDYDGASETFEPVSVTCYSDGQGNSMFVYPNPATDVYNVSVNSTEDILGASIELVDMNGKRVSLQNVTIKKGNNTFTYSSTGVIAGTYYIRVSGDNLTLKPILLIIK